MPRRRELRPWTSVTTTEGDLHLLAGGAGPPVLLLHGGIIDAARVSWGAVLDPLATECRVYAPDLLGYGASDLPPGPYPVSRHVDAVEELIEEVGVTPTAVGLSLGGAVGFGLARRRPDLVAGLVAIDSYGLGRELPNGRRSYLLARAQILNRVAIAAFRRSRRLTRASLGGIVADLDALDEAAVDAVYAEVQRPTAGAAFRRFRAAEVTREGYRTCYRPDLPEIGVPVRLLHGARDEVVPRSWAEHAAERLPRGELVVLEGCAHWPPREAPERVVSEVRDFVA